MTSLHRPITRLTSVIDYRTHQPFVVRLEAGGQLVRIRPRGTRTWRSSSAGPIVSVTTDQQEPSHAPTDLNSPC
jgi:hypothetical protein